MLSILAKLLKALNSEASPAQIALALSMALVVALTPLFSWHNLLILLLALIIRVNLSAFFVGTAVFGILAIAVDPLSAMVGERLLTEPGLQAFWTDLYQHEFWRISGFNHTLVLGGLVLSLAAFVPVFFIAKVLVIKYRERLLVWVEKLWITKLIKGSKFYNLYMQIAG